MGKHTVPGTITVTFDTVMLPKPGGRVMLTDEKPKWIATSALSFLMVIPLPFARRAQSLAACEELPAEVCPPLLRASLGPRQIQPAASGLRDQGRGCPGGARMQSSARGHELPAVFTPDCTPEGLGHFESCRPIYFRSSAFVDGRSRGRSAMFWIN